MLNDAYSRPDGGTRPGGAAVPGVAGRRGPAGQPLPLTLGLDQAAAGQRWLAGGKAAGLAVLKRAGFPVPRGFCVTVAAFNQFLDASSLRPELDRLLSEILTAPPSRVHELSAQALASLAAAPIPGPVEAAILEAWRAMGEERAWAVRSSATVEDGTGHSFAGQFESVLNVRGREALLAAVKHCWLSLYSPRALACHVRERLPLAQTAVAVVIQEMVPADAAGVLFTVDPVSGDTGRLVIEAVPGLGDRLVSGRAAPECVVLNKADLRIVKRRGPAGAPCLDDARARQLAKLACKAERLFEGPLDIEWARAGRRIFLLQARPATAAPKRKSWEERQNWCNLNTGEIFPDVTTPMTWSIIQGLMAPVFRSVFGLAGADSRRAPVAGLVAGRIYFNANTGVAAVRPFWFLAQGLGRLGQAVGGGQASEYVRGFFEIPDSDLPDLGFSWPGYILSWPRVLWDLVTHSPSRGEAWTRRLKTQNDEFFTRDIEAMSLPELAAALNHLARERFEDWDLLYLITQGATLPLYEWACRRWLSDSNLALGHRLFAGLGRVPEVEAGLALWRLAALAHADAELAAILGSDDEWPRVHAKLSLAGQGGQFLSAWDAFMFEHGHHCRGELEAFNARWSETPGYILGVVRGYVRSMGQSDPIEHHRRIAQERRDLTEECRRRLGPLKRRLFSFALVQAQRFAVSREVWKNQAVRQIFGIRRILLALGRRLCQQGVLSDPDDIFFLEVGEVAPVVDGTARFNARDLVFSRRKAYQENLALSPPAGVGSVFDSAPVPAIPPGPDATVLEGIPVSPGVVTGPARVILRADFHEQVLAGEILVAPFTDPAWTPYFIPAAGLVADQGGVLSHGSIVARELGLPAVTNTLWATRMIRTGDILRLDGDRGRVTILERARR